MITKIRQFIDSKAAKVLLILLVAAIGGLFTLPLMFKKGSGGPWIAKINGVSPSYNDFSKKVMTNERRIRDFRAQYGQLADMLMQSMGMNLNPQVLAANQLIQEELLNQLVDKLDIHVDAQYVEDMLVDPNAIFGELSEVIPPAVYDFERGGIDSMKLKNYLRRFGITITEFEEEIQRLVKRNFVLKLALGASYEPQSMIRSAFIQKHVPRNFSVLTFDFEKYLKDVKSEPISKKDLKIFFDEQNKKHKRYFVPEKRSGMLWEFDAQSYGLVLDQDEVESYYNGHRQRKYVEAPVKLEVRRIFIKDSNALSPTQAIKPLKVKAIDLHKELIADSSLFAQKAKELSDDKESAKNGGLLPVFSRGTYERDFEKAAFLLKNDADISKVITTKDGYEIVQRVRRISAVVKPLSAVKSEIKNTLLEKKFKNQFYKDMKRFIRGDHKDTYKDELLAKKRKVVAIDPMEKADNKLAKSLFKKKSGEYSFYIDGGRGFVVQTTKINKRFLPALEAAKITVETDMYEQRASKALVKAMSSAQEKAKTGSLDSLKVEFDAKMQTTGMIKPDDADKMKALKKRGLPVDQMLALEKVGMIGSSMGAADGYLFKVEAVESFSEDEFIQAKAEINKTLKVEGSQLVVAALVAFLHRTAKIEVNKTIVNIGE